MVMLFDAWYAVVARFSQQNSDNLAAKLDVAEPPVTEAHKSMTLPTHYRRLVRLESAVGVTRNRLPCHSVLYIRWFMGKKGPHIVQSGSK